MVYSTLKKQTHSNNSFLNSLPSKERGYECNTKKNETLGPIP